MRARCLRAGRIRGALPGRHPARRGSAGSTARRRPGRARPGRSRGGRFLPGRRAQLARAPGLRIAPPRGHRWSATGTARRRPRGGRRAARREEQGHARALDDGGAGRPEHPAGAPARRDRRRQGGRRRSASTRARRARRRPFVRAQLRGALRDAARERALRPRARRLHRRGQTPSRACSRRPTAAPSSSTRSASCRRRLQAKLLRVLEERQVLRVGGAQAARRSTCASSPRPTAISRPSVERGTLPRGPLLPPQRDRPDHPAAARAARARSCRWRGAFLATRCRRARTAGEPTRRARGAGAWLRALRLARQRARAAQRRSSARSLLCAGGPIGVEHLGAPLATAAPPSVRTAGAGLITQPPPSRRPRAAPADLSPDRLREMLGSASARRPSAPSTRAPATRRAPPRCWASRGGRCSLGSTPTRCHDRGSGAGPERALPRAPAAQRDRARDRRARSVSRSGRPTAGGGARARRGAVPAGKGAARQRPRRGSVRQARGESAHRRQPCHAA